MYPALQVCVHCAASVISPSQFAEKPAPFGTVLEQSAAVHVNSVPANVPAAQVYAWPFPLLLSVYPALHVCVHCAASVASASQFAEKPAPFGTVLEQSAVVHVNSVPANVPAAQVYAWPLPLLLSVYPALHLCVHSAASVSSASQFAKKPAPFGTVLEQSAAAHVNSVPANVPAAQVYAWPLPLLLSVYPALHVCVHCAASVASASQFAEKLAPFGTLLEQSAAVHVNSVPANVPAAQVYAWPLPLLLSVYPALHVCVHCAASVTSPSQFVEKPAPVGTVAVHVLAAQLTALKLPSA
jgi:hypothetical protein